MTKLMMTGFEPFGRELINPSWLAVNRLPENIGDIEVVKVKLPTVYGKALDELFSLIKKHDPDVIISVGQAGGRNGISVERIAINVDDASIPDNKDQQPIDKPIFSGAPNAYFTNLPIKAMVKQIRDEVKVPAYVSNSAGTFVGNHVMYGSLFYLHHRSSQHECGLEKSGFIHVPFLPEQVLDKRSEPSMSLDDITKGLIVAAKTACKFDQDIKEEGGAIH